MMELPLTEEGGGSFHYLISSSDGCIAKKSVPGELVIELLSYLPIKSVCKFRCVSKSWLKLFTNDPFFAKLHLTHQSNESKLHITSFLAKEHPKYPNFRNTKFHLAETSDNFKKFQLPFRPETPPAYYLVRGICNGMVLLGSFRTLHIWNPLTRDYIHIPTPPHYYPHDPSRCRSFGFGLNEASNEYKVVRYVGYADESNNHIFRSCVSVCTFNSLSREPSWRTIEPFDQYYTRLKDCTVPHVNGALHWLATRIPRPYLRVILSFDLKEEVFKEMPRPHPTELFSKDVYFELVELGGLLCMSGIQFEVELQIWVMKQYGVFGSWTKQFKIGLLGVCGSLESLQPVGIANSGEIILTKNFEGSTKKLILYNAETDSVRDVKIFDSDHWYAYAYTGSLISPKYIS